MPRPASHPGETIFKSLPWHGAGHRQTSPRRSNAETTMFQSTRYCSLKGDKLPVAVDRHGIVLCRNEAVVHEPTVANRTDRVAVDKFLLAQKRPVAGGDEPGALEGNPWSKTLSRDTLPRALHWSHCSLDCRARKVRRHTHEFTSASGMDDGDEPSTVSLCSSWSDTVSFSDWSRHASRGEVAAI